MAMSAWVVIPVLMLYAVIIVMIATYGDVRSARRGGPPVAQPTVYALSLAVYCTSWTLFGSVGRASDYGLDFLAIYLGPMIVLLCFWGVVRKIVRISKAQNLTSIADFIGARYGKSQFLAAMVTLITIIGITPYIALQLKAVVSGYQVLVGFPELSVRVTAPLWWQDSAFWVALFMGVFSILFGARSIDATEHHEGMILAIAFESIVKLVAFLTVGIVITWGVFGGLDSLAVLASDPQFSTPVTVNTSWLYVSTLTVLSISAFVLLPRQYHVMVVENNDESELRRAAWVMPSYLIIINLFVVPIAVAGLLIVGDQSSPDLYVLSVPLALGMPELALLAYIGGVSAATGMIVVATVAMATMVSNDMVMPFVLRRSQLQGVEQRDFTRTILMIRRASIMAILLFGWIYYRFTTSDAALSAIGVTSFAAAAQFLPAVIAGLYWRRGTRWGVMAGLMGGFAIWLDSLLLPSLGYAPYLSTGLATFGADEMAALRDTDFWPLLDPFSAGVISSLLMNILLLVGVSLLTPLPAIERFQAEAFVNPLVERRPLRRSQTATVSVAEIRNILDRFLGFAQTEHLISRYQKSQNVDLLPMQRANLDLLDFAEKALSGVIGASSARVVVASIVGGATLKKDEMATILSDASDAIRHNRDMLQITMDTVRQGILAFDDTQRLVLWNKQYLHLFDVAETDIQVGMSYDEVLGQMAVMGSSHDETLQRLLPEEQVLKRPSAMVFETLPGDGRILEIQTNPMPDGGTVLSVNDVTERAKTARLLAQSKGELEERVEERTRALTLLNLELDRARKEAEQANIGKTRFLAAASHDLLQPLNAAHLFASALGQKLENTEEDELMRRLMVSLSSVEELLGTLLDISKLDAGGTQPDVHEFTISEVLDALMLEFSAMATEKGLKLSVHGSNLWVKSDPKLLRRILQNLMANALRYTETGRVVIGCRRRGGNVRIDVVDSGPGIPGDKLTEIFREFAQLKAGKEDAYQSQGLGLGLAIVDRLAKLLSHTILVRSEQGRGSTFSVTVPMAEPQEKPLAVPKTPNRSQQKFMGRRLLILDNEPEVLEGMRVLLESWGGDVAVARTPQDAQKVFKAHKPELMVVDYHLDEGEIGVNAALDIFKTADDVPVVVATADYSDELRDIVQEAGFYLTRKPIKPAGFRALLGRLLS